MPVAEAMEARMDRKVRTRVGLAEKAYKLAVVVIPFLTEIIKLISKVVNYAGRVPELRVRVQAEG